MLARMIIGMFLVAGLVASGSASEALSDPYSVAGRWDITVRDPRGHYPSWIEIAETGGGLTGRFVGRVGGARPASQIALGNGRIAFRVPPQFEVGGRDLVFEGEFHGTWMKGTTDNDIGRRVTWTAVRAPALEPRAVVEWGEPIRLFDGRRLDGWVPRHPRAPFCWTVADGALTNGLPCVDLMTRRKFRDFKLHIECKVGEHGDSGIHLRGRYEIQIRDETNAAPGPASDATGSLYGFIAPILPVIAGPDEWQSFDITLVGRRLTVERNGETLIDDQEIPGITGDALDSDEGEPGPIVLQGYLGQVAFRNIVLTPAR